MGRGCARTTAASCRTSSCRRCSDEPLTIYGDGSQTRSFCYVADEVEGIYRLFMRGDNNPTNVGNPDEFTVRQLAELVIELTGTTAQDRRARRFPSTIRRSASRTSRARARCSAGSPAVSLSDGVTRTIEYFRSVLREGSGLGPRVARVPLVMLRVCRPTPDPPE